MPPRIILHSGRHHPRWAKHSLTGDPGAQACLWTEGSPGDPLGHLERYLQTHPDIPFAGYFSYDLARSLETLPHQAIDDRQWPIYQFLELQRLAHQPAGRNLRVTGPFKAGEVKPQRSGAEYAAMVEQALGYIGAGDVFQVNLSQRFSASWQGDPSVAFARLMRASPAWYGACIPFPPTGPGLPWRWLVSASPELFLEWPGDRTVITRPIKGTRPTSVAPSQLTESEKDTAELHMIVDLMRNDLGRVCDFGSVLVENPREIESHPTVHHGVATLSGRLRAGVGLADTLRATFPGGSVTGAPKIRAMEIIDELELTRRGPYCGAFGWLQSDARGVIQGCLAMTIRTLLFEGYPSPNGPFEGTVDFSVGGGIVADSVPQDEYQETLDKATALIKTLVD